MTIKTIERAGLEVAKDKLQIRRYHRDLAEQFRETQILP